MRRTMERQRLYLHTQGTGSRETDRVCLGIAQQDEKRQHKPEYENLNLGLQQLNGLGSFTDVTVLEK